jgi:hypothetical protein
VKSLQQPETQTSDNLLLSDKIIPVAVEAATLPSYFLVMLRVENCGGTALTNVVVTDNFSNETKPLEPSANTGTVSITPADTNGFQKENLTWTIGTLGGYQARTLTIKVGGRPTRPAKSSRPPRTRTSSTTVMAPAEPVRASRPARA